VRGAGAGRMAAGAAKSSQLPGGLFTYTAPPMLLRAPGHDMVVQVQASVPEPVESVTTGMALIALAPMLRRRYAAR
jgi:hypothetical protein